MGAVMKKILTLLVTFGLSGFLTISALEKAETPDINPETAGLAKDFSGIKTRTGRYDVQSLGQRFGELFSKGLNRTPEEQKEYLRIREVLRERLTPAVFDETFPSQ